MAHSRLSSRTTRLAAATGLVAASLAAGALVSPADAATTGNTTLTIALTGGALNVSAPAAKTLAVTTVAGVRTASASLGDVQVDDERGAPIATWGVTISATNFVEQSGNTKTFSSNGLTYVAGSVNGLLGFGETLLGGGTAGVTVPLATLTYNNAGVNTVMAGAFLGNNSAKWNPTVSMVVPSTATVGTYQSTLTHSVS